LSGENQAADNPGVCAKNVTGKFLVSHSDTSRPTLISGRLDVGLTPQYRQNGTVSYIVVLRTREIGIRMAVGAQKRDILGLMLRASMRPVLAGLLVGVFLAVGASYLLRGVLYGLSTIDGISFIGASLLFLAIALLATYLPSRRAMRIDPMVALRYE
jgi:hypothetical protein